jgi:hypothetical protein
MSGQPGNVPDKFHIKKSGGKAGARIFDMCYLIRDNQVRGHLYPHLER